MTSSDPGNEPYSATVDLRVLLFTLTVSFVATLFFSLAPALHFLRPNLAVAAPPERWDCIQECATPPQGCRRYPDCPERLAPGRRGTFRPYPR